MRRAPVLASTPSPAVAVASPSLFSPRSNDVSQFSSPVNQRQFLGRSSSDLGSLGDSLIAEKRSDVHGSRASMIRHERPALSRYRREDSEMRALHTALQDSARVRDDCQRSISTDYDATKKSRQVASKLQSMLRRLESVAAAAASVAQLGASERESIIHALRVEVAAEEENAERAASSASESIAEATLRHQQQLNAIVNVMRASMREAERTNDRLGAQLAKEVAEREWREGEDDRKRVAAEAAHKEKVDQLLRTAIQKLSHVDLNRGWNSWLGIHEYKLMLKRRAANAFRNRLYLQAFNEWKEMHPPESTERRIVELKRQLKQEKAVTNELRVELKQVKREVVDNDEAVDRWIDFAGLMQCFRIWRVRYRPRMLDRAIEAPLKSKMASLEARLRTKYESLSAKLREEQSEHNRLKRASARLFAEKDWVREEAKKCELLNALVEHQQRCLSEALQATSWTQCRQLLYHESLRYVQSAATHGKTLENGIRRERFRRSASGVLVPSGDLEVMKRQAKNSIERALSDEVRDAQLAEAVGVPSSAGRRSPTVTAMSGYRASREGHESSTAGRTDTSSRWSSPSSPASSTFKATPLEQRERAEQLAEEDWAWMERSTTTIGASTRTRSPMSSRTPTSSVRPASSVRSSERRAAITRQAPRLIDQQLEMERSDEEFEEEDDESIRWLTRS